jgi:sugar/nucleoside kinase (ribokinase family)
VWSEPEGSGELPVDPIEAVDTLGAGDFFHGAFCHALAGGTGFVDGLRAASGVATLSCRSFGTRAWLEDLTGAKPLADARGSVAFGPG